MRFRVGGFQAEVLTAMVTTGYGPLMLTRTMPGRWTIQRPGRPEEDATPVWDGSRFVTHACGTTWDDDQLVGAVEAAMHGLKAERDASGGVS